MHEGQANREAAEKPDAQTAGNCLSCGRSLTHRGPDGECLRCLLSLGFLADGEESLAGRAQSRRTGPLRYAHFEVDTGADGYPVELGAGAMAITYRARDTILHSTVALKVIDRKMAENTAARARFLREARAAAQLHHPNIARVTHYGEQDGECFYAMEFIDGETLEERVRREGPLPLELALEITLQVARALAAAEACGVVHRDLKPSNLMIASRQGEADANDSLIVKVIDFGVAKLTAAGADQTQAGFIGTPVFASPEQFGIAGRTPVDTRSDIYSLGITLWYLLTGRTPFTGRTLEEIRARQSEEPPLDQLKARDIPAQVVALLRSMLAIDPATRPQSARELLAAVLRCYKGEQEPPAAVEAAARQEEGFWVAVLPFKFSGANSEIALLSEGLNEEIITALSRFPYLRVIARSSTARYATETADVRRVGHELGARYILEGSLRQTGNNLRIAVQLVDADSGAHLWAETFDHDLQRAGLFELRDEIADRVVTTVGDVYGVLARAIAAMTRTKQPETLTPYEAVWRFFLAQQRGSAEDHLSARRALEHAVELQPTNADVWAALAILIIDENRHGFNSRPDSLDRALRAAEHAIDADPVSQMANYAFAEAQYFRGDLGAFRAAAERALALNSRCSYTIAHLGLLFCLSGDWERGLQLATRAIDLCPHHPGWYCYGHFFNEYRQRNYAEALAILQQINMPDFWGAHYFAAMTQAQLGNRDAAQAEVERTLQVWPDFEATFGRKHLAKWIRNQPDLIAHVIEGVKLAGFRLGADSKEGDKSLSKISWRRDNSVPFRKPVSFTPSAVSRRKRLIWIAAVSLLVIAAIIAGLWFLSRAPLPAGKEASVAVLPFENLSPASEDSFFTVGMQDEISADLARIKALKVIGPESTQDYLPGNRDFARIGRELGVSYLVTGSVRRENGKMRVAVRLIDPQNKVTPWTKEYERPLSEVFALKSAITRDLSARLQAPLSPSEGELLNEPPTNDPIAYDLYLRATTVPEMYDSAGDMRKGLTRRIAWLDEAVARDPDFVLAYCELAKAHDSFGMASANASAEERAIDHRALAEVALQKARRLRPDEGKVHLAEAVHFLLTSHDDEQARVEIELARRTLPNDPELEQIAGRIARDQGRWHDAAQAFEKATVLQPRVSILFSDLADAYRSMRNYAGADRAIARVQTLEPKDIYYNFWRASLAVEARADLEPLRAALAAAPPPDEEDRGMILRTHLILTLCAHDPGAVSRLLAEWKRPFLYYVGISYPKDWFEGLAARMRGDAAAAQTSFTAARQAVEPLVQAKPGSGPSLGLLAMIDAGLGRKSDAINEAHRACELMPAKKSAMGATFVNCQLAVVYAWTDQAERAIALLDEMANQAAGETMLFQPTYGDLKLNPVWDPLRKEPKFNALLERLAPSTSH